MVCTVCSTQIPCNDLVQIVGDKAYEELERRVYDVLEDYVVRESPNRPNSRSLDSKTIHAIELCRAHLKVENALNRPFRVPMACSGLKDLQRLMAKAPDGGIEELALCAVVYHGGLMELLRAWLSRTVVIFDLNLDVDPVDKEVSASERTMGTAFNNAFS